MTASGSRAKAFTRIELMVVLAIGAVLLLLFVASNDDSRMNSKRISCVNNLKQIGIAYRLWSNDNGDQFPVSVPQTNGGWRELVNSQNAGAYVWTNYITMGNEVGRSPAIFICPTDERITAYNFADIRNTNVSYFIGPEASDKYPQGILGGDRNLGPGNIPRDDYGFSSPDGRGNDVTIKSPVCWSLKMHSKGNTSGAGNILLGDGSVQQVTSGNLNLVWLKSEMDAYANSTNGLVSSNGIRLIFP